MATITALLSSGWGWIAGLAALVAALFASYFGGKKIGTVKTQAKADVEKAEVKAEATKAAAEHESKVVNNADQAKADTANRTDDELRDRMREKWTEK